MILSYLEDVRETFMEKKEPKQDQVLHNEIQKQQTEYLNSPEIYHSPSVWRKMRSLSKMGQLLEEEQ